MTPSRWNTVILGVAALGCAVLLVWAAGAGPVEVVGEQHRTTQQVDRQPGDRDFSLDGDVETGPGGAPTAEDGVDQVPWVDDVVALVLTVGVMLVGAALVMVVVGRFTPRRRDDRVAAGALAAYDLESLREEIGRAAEVHRGALDTGDVRDGIIACWVRLEEAAARAGAARSPSDTPTEFVIRLLHALDVDPRAVGALAALYREARFSSHRMPEDSRARARQALDAIAHDLRVGVG